ncbi:hypothetical protein H5410_026681 [Solanum commersonii]|uniref:Uncharacterized protein n=1 Tax=Solanum commersonii TaxID=4109 RepID=A0A9J5YZ83_SOLCO|nr:hypothetical protein H5410_026681 [Solanum commersonii]
MIEEVDIVFNYGGNWVISPKLGYSIKFQHTWYYNTCLVCYDDLCEAFTSKFGFKEVQQLLVTGPSGTYYVIEDNDGIKTLQYLFSKDFKVINFYAIDAHELRVYATNIIYHNLESYSVDVEAALDCDYTTFKVKTLKPKHTCGDSLLIHWQLIIPWRFILRMKFKTIQNTLSKT